MYNRKKIRYCSAALLLLPGLMLPSCSLMSCSLLLAQLQPTAILSTHPDGRNSVLGAEGKISVHFAAGVDHGSAENLVQITTLQGSVAGSHSWEKERLEFFPSQPLTPGRRYSLEIRGELYFEDGRSLRVQRSIPFFYLRRPDPDEEALRYLPQSGSTLAAESTVVLNFSQPVDKTNIIQDLRISPFSDYLFQWDETGRRLTVSPLRGWENSSLCRFDFASLAYPSAAYYIEYQSPQCLTIELSPVQLDWQQNFPPAACELSSLPHDCSIQLHFSKPVNQEDFASTVLLEPFCRGSLFWKDASTAVFIPAESFSPAVTYRCNIDADFTDTNRFTTAGALPRIVSVQGEAADSIPDEIEAATTTCLEITPSGPEGMYSFLCEYEEGVDVPAARAQLQSRAYLRTLFPPDLPSPEVVSFLWPDATHMLIQIQGFGIQADGRTAYYSFHLPEIHTEPAVLQLRVTP